MKKWMIGVLLLGAGFGGAVVGQAFQAPSVLDAMSTKPDKLLKLAEDYATEYTVNVGYAKSAVQVSQTASEASVRLQLVQIRQNAEIIRLLKKQVGEK